MKTLNLIAIMLFINFAAFTQAKYKPGYIVTAKGDTIKGFVDYKEGGNSQSFAFKADLNQPEKQITVANARAVGIVGYDEYEKFTTAISQGRVDVASLTTELDSTSKVDSVFLRVIIRGKKISLYSYTDNIKTRYYILTATDGKLTELKYYLYLSAENRSVLTATTYRWQLISVISNILPGDPKVIAKIKNAEYTTNNLAGIIQAANGNTDGKTISHASSTSRFFIGAGMRNNKLLVEGENSFFDAGANASKSSPIFNGGIDFVLNKETQKLILRAEVMLANTTYDIPNQYVTIKGWNASLNFTQSNVSVIPQVIYNFYSTKALKVFLDVGLSFNFASYNDFDYIYYAGASMQRGTMKNYPVFEKVWATYPVKAGVVIGNHLELYATYLSASSIMKYVSTSTSIAAYQGGVSYIW